MQDFGRLARFVELDIVGGAARQGQSRATETGAAGLAAGGEETAISKAASFKARIEVPRFELELLLLLRLSRQRHAIVVDRRSDFRSMSRSRQPITGGIRWPRSSAPIADRKASERKFYSRMAIFLVVVVFLGFAPSFYLKGIVPSYPRPNPTLPPAVIFHGLMFTLWMALLVVQTQLISDPPDRKSHEAGQGVDAARDRTHPSDVLYCGVGCARESHPPFTDSLNWTAIPLAVIPAFAFLVYEAWRRRKGGPVAQTADAERVDHFAAGPGFSRIPLAPPTFWGFAAQLLIGTSLLFAPLVHLGPANASARSTRRPGRAVPSRPPLPSSRCADLRAELDERRHAPARVTA